MPNNKYQASKAYIREKLNKSVLLRPIADQLGVSTSFLSMCKSDLSPSTIPMDRIVAFAKACPGVDPTELLFIRLQEELGEPELRVLWASFKILHPESSREATHDACVELARASRDCDAQLERICEEENQYEQGRGLEFLEKALGVTS